jgi:hypothetical protein
MKGARSLRTEEKNVFWGKKKNEMEIILKKKKTSILRLLSICNQHSGGSDRSILSSRPAWTT